MADSIAPDVLAYMSAYTLLGADYAATPAQVRSAYLLLVKRNHPDKFEAGSQQQRQATTRLARINEAYGLVQDAPLRFHRVSRGSDPDLAWTDAELARAIDQARWTKRFDLAIAMVAVLLLLIVVPVLVQRLGPALPSAMRMPALGLATLFTSAALWMVLGGRGVHLLRLIDTAALTMLRVVRGS